MTRKEIIMMAIAKKLTWIKAAEILQITDRHMRRLKKKYEEHGFGGLRDHRSGTPRRKRIDVKVIEQILRLKEHKYHDYSVAHFHETLGAKHGIKLSETWTRHILQDAGLVERAPGRGKHRRQRDREQMRGSLIHMDASRHTWLPDLPQQDLNVVLDDADGNILFAEFIEEEGTMSTLRALHGVVTTHGRFSSLYTDRGSHFCTTTHAGEGPDAEQGVQVRRGLKILGIRHILAFSPQARGRSERTFGTIQGRLPQELRVAGVRSYEEANKYLQEIFVPHFNKRFGVKAAHEATCFTPASVSGMDLALVLSIKHDRTVRNDNTVSYKRQILQIPPTQRRISYARCEVQVHEFIDGTLGICYLGALLAHYSSDGELLPLKSNPQPRKAA